MLELKLQELTRHNNYPIEAFVFVHNALEFTVRRVHGKAEDPNQNRHIAGPQLCYGLRDYAIEQYGLMARTVLQHWRIHSCEDFGKIVFALVEAGVMAKTEHDCIDDFVGVYDFPDAFSPTLSIN